MKIRPVVAEFFHAKEQAERRTDMKKLIVTFCNFSEAPKEFQRLRTVYVCVLSTNIMNIHVDLNATS
jgi:hypothetical protein